MDAALFTKMLSDKNVLDLRGLGYQFPQADIKEFTELVISNSDRKSTRLNSSHRLESRMPSSA